MQGELILKDEFNQNFKFIKIYKAADIDNNAMGGQK